MKYDNNKDWCTAWPDRWDGVDYSLCCFRHDAAYAQIRKMDNFLGRVWARRVADYKLAKCVWKRGLPLMGIIMLFGVRAFGWITTWRGER